jgi:DNA-binding LacI/PurR family transcriptional regulator
MASVREIAKRVGVSVATVSRALNDHPYVDPETKERVIAEARLSGYFSSVGKRSTSMIGLVYPSAPVAADYGTFESALLSGIMQGVEEQKFDVTIVNVMRDRQPSETYSQFFRRKGLRGVILRTFEHTREMCVQIAREGFPAVVVADRFDEPEVNFICCESRLDSRRAVEHLVHLGHRDIALAIHGVSDTDHRDRREGYLEALRSLDIPLRPDLQIEITGTMQGGTHAINRLMSLPSPPTAIFFTDPLATLGAMFRCLEAGIEIPNQLSLVGFDDSDIRKHVWPMITAVAQDASMLGREASLWLTRRLSGRGPRNLRSIRTTLFEINRTTAAPAEQPIRLMPDGQRLQVSKS